MKRREFIAGLGPCSRVTADARAALCGASDPALGSQNGE
jgi:hypothetical protein